MVEDATHATDDWQSLHVFYAANANPVLVHGVAPLVARLRERGLLRRWFFIRYWMEGPHVRLRMLPTSLERAAELRAEAEESVTAFLRRRPALYEEDRNGMGELYRGMYLAEYSEQSWNERYGPDGEMPFRDNNSAHWIAYEREYDRYGGRDAMPIAEWHFERSSELVLRLIAGTNVHVRTVLLGQAAQLTMGLCFTFLRSTGAVRQFLERYRTMWETSYQESSEGQHDTFDSSYERMAPQLNARLAHLRDCAWGLGTDTPTPIERDWLDHCADLRGRILDLSARGPLTFTRGSVADPEAVLAILLSSYVHMTNNRLGVSILDEIYLSYVICRALEATDDARVGR